MKELVALYKAYRGGEWFRASLQSIAGHVSRVFVVMADRPWSGEADLPNNCREPLEGFAAAHPDVPVQTLTVESARQEDQYAAGLEAIRASCGNDVAVLIVDTDELWDAASLDKLRLEIDAHPETLLFRGGIFTYLRSPRYQVWPQEDARPAVALQSPVVPSFVGRFRNVEPSRFCAGVTFHHFSYVRADPADIPIKFAATSSQEDDPSSPAWLTTVWPRLPLGQNLHMTRGHEHCWPEVKVLHNLPMPVPLFCGPILEEEDLRWAKIVEAQSPAEAMIPTPNDHDATKYPEFARLAPDVALLRKRLKMSYLEALVMHRWASSVPAGGRILEIGSGSGGSLAIMGLSAPGAELWAVDPFAPYDERTHAGTARGVREGNETQFRNTALTYGYLDRVRNIKLNSDQAAEHCPDDAFDLVFVDGNHTYEIVKSDLELYWPKVRPGGLLVGHDYTTRFPGVIQAAIEWGVPYGVYPGTSLFYARKPT